MALSASPSPPGGPGAVGQEAEVKFKAAQAKAKLGGVHTLTQKDIDGLSLEQIKQLRGYCATSPEASQPPDHDGGNVGNCEGQKVEFTNGQAALAV